MPCEDANGCTANDVCHAGGCLGIPIACDDGNGCTSNGCLPGVGCTFAAIAVACEDGDACTTNPHCVAGACVGDPIGCDDDDACTTDACAAGECTHVVTEAPCDDGVDCTTGDHCVGGSCAGGVNICGCMSDVECAQIGDGNSCNGKPFCDKSQLPWHCEASDGIEGDCSEVDVGPCATATCSPASGSCLAVAKPNGTACSDGSVCTAADVCGAGACQPGKSLFCNDEDTCTTDTCDPKTGCQFPAAPDGTACGLGHVCVKGACAEGGCPLYSDLLLDVEVSELRDVRALVDGGWTMVGTSPVFATGQPVGWIGRVNMFDVLMWQVLLPQIGDAGLSGVAGNYTDSAFTAVGQVESLDGGTSRGWAVRVDGAGKVKWQTVLDTKGFDGLRDVVVVPGGDAIAAGDILVPGKEMQQAWLVRIGAGGKVVWQKTVGGNSNDGFDGIAALADGVVACGISYSDGKDGDGEGLLARFGGDGSVVWQTLVKGPKYETFRAITATQGGQMYAVGTTNGAGAGSYDGMITALEGGKKPAWTQYYGWTKEDRLQGIASFGDGVIVVGVSYSTPKGDADGWIARIDNSGKEQWSKVLGGPLYDRLSAVDVTKDGTLVAVGMSNGGFDGEKPTKPHGWVLRMDGSGSTECGK